MSKNALTTYQFPTQMQREFHQLMNSKESFLKNLSSAEQRKLEALYVELTNAWQRNHTETLNQVLETKYQELREIQQLIKSDCADFRKSTEQSLSADIQRKKQKLTTQKSSLEEKKKELEQTQQHWNLTLESKLQDLLQKRRFLDELSQKQKQALEQIDLLLEKEKTNLTQLQTLKEERLRQQESASYKLRERQEVYQANLQNLKSLLENSLLSLKTLKEEKLREFRSQAETFRLHLDERERILKQDIENYELQLLEQLKAEMLEAEQNCPEELKELYNQGQSSQISSRTSNITEETKKLGNALSRGLSKIGLDKKGVDADKFIELMEQHAP